MPVPEDLTLIAAGIVAHRGAASLLHAVLVGVAGVICADWMVYMIGRRYGRNIVQIAAGVTPLRGAAPGLGARRGGAPRRPGRVRGALRLRRSPGDVPRRGHIRRSPARFGIAEAAGAVIYVPAMVTLGFLFSERAERIMRDVTHAQHWLELIGLVALAGYLGLRAWGARAGLGPTPR